MQLKKKKKKIIAPIFLVRYDEATSNKSYKFS